MTDTMIDVRFNVLTNMGSLNAQIDTLNAKMAAHLKLIQGITAQQAALNSASSKWTSIMKGSGQFDVGLVNVGKQVDEFGKRLAKNQLSLGEYRRAIREYRRGVAGEVRQLAEYQQRMMNSVTFNRGGGEMLVATPNGINKTTDAAKLFNQEQAVMNTVLKKSNESLINWGKNTQWAGRQLTVGLTLPVVIFGATAAKVFLDADKRLTNLAKVYGSGVTGTTTEGIKQIKAQVMDLTQGLSESTCTSLNDLLDLSADIAATGKEGSDLLKTITSTNRLMVLGDIERQDAMKTTLSLQTAFKQNNEELANSINFLNAAENATSLSMSDMTEAIPRAGTVVEALGGDVQDLALYMTAMREGGISAAEGANALKAGLASIINPSTKAKKILAGYGIDIESIVETNKGQLTPTILALQKELSGLDGLARSQSIAALFGKYQFARMSALFENIGAEGSQTLEIMKLMGMSAGQLGVIADKEMKQKTESLSNRWQRAINSIKNDMISVGQDFVQIALPIMGFIDKILKMFNALPDSVKTIVEVVTALGAILGPAVMTLGIMANFVGQIKKGWNLLGGFGARMMGRPRPEFEQPLDPQTIAHMASLDKDTQAVFDHAAAIKTATDAMRASVAALNLGGEHRRAAGVVSSPVSYGSQNPFLITGSGLPAATSGGKGGGSVKSNHMLMAIAAQMLGESFSGRPFVGATIQNPTIGDSTPLFQASVDKMKSISSTLNRVAANLQDADPVFAAALRETATMLQNPNRPGTEYSHFISSEDPVHGAKYGGKSFNPFYGFMESVTGNQGRAARGKSGGNPSVMPGEFDPTFIAGQQEGMFRLYNEGGAALWAEATRNPELMNSLKFHIAAATSKSAEEMGQMLTRLGNGVDEEFKQQVVGVGDSWREYARKSVAREGLNPDEFTFDTPLSSERPAPNPKPLVPLPAPETKTARTIPQMSASMALAGDAVSYQMTTMKDAAGESVRVFRLLDQTGLELALAMENAEGELVDFNVNNMEAAGLNPGEGGAAAARAKRNKVHPVMGDTVDAEAVAGNQAARERYQAEYAEWEKVEKKKERAAKNNAPASNWGQAFNNSAQESAEGTARATREVADNAEETVVHTKNIAGNVANVAGGFGLLLSMSTLFLGNMDSAFGKFAMIGGTAMSMLPMLEQMTNLGGEGGLITKFSQNFSNQMGNMGDGAIGRLSSRVTAGAGRMAMAGKALAGAMFGPWGLAIGIAAAGIGILIANNKKKWEKYVQDAKDAADNMKKTFTNVAADNADIFKLKPAADAWNGYTVNATGAAAASKTMVDQVKSNNADMIDGLKKLDDEDLARRLKEIYSGLIIKGVSPQQADQFLNALGQALDKTTLTVKVVAELSGWAKGKDKEEMFNAAKANASKASPDVDLSHQVSAYYDANGIEIPHDGERMFLTDEFKAGKEAASAYGTELGTIISDGIQAGLITPENGKLTENLQQMYETIKADLVAQTNGEGVLDSMLTDTLNGPKIQSLFASVGVPIEQGVDGLVDKFMLLDQAGRDNLLKTLESMGAPGRSLANTLNLVQGSTDAMTASTVALNPDLAKVVGLAQAAGGGLTMYAGGLDAAAASSAAFGVAVGEMTTGIEKATSDFAGAFSSAVDDYVKNYVENTREANAAMVKDTREAEQAKMKALKDGFDKKEKAAQDNIDKIKKNADKEIDAIKRTEDKRKAAFEAEQERIRRLTALKNYNVDYNEAVAGGDLFAAARIRNERDAFNQNNKLEDKNAAAGNAADKKIAAIENERDKKVEAAETALAKMKAADEASVESAQKASDKRIEATEAAATASNKAAEKWKENQEKIVKAMKAEFAEAKGDVAATWKVAEKYAPKFGVSAKTAATLWTDAWDGLGKRTGSKINKESKDPKLAEAARQFTIKTIADALGIKVSARGQALMAGASPKMSVAEYFAARANGQSDTTLAIGAGLAGFADGGSVSGPGGPKDDKIPAWLSHGEFVHTAEAVNHYGPEFMESVNKRKFPRFAKGGMVGQDYGGILGSAMSRMLLPTIGRIAVTTAMSQIATAQHATASANASTGGGAGANVPVLSGMKSAEARSARLRAAYAQLGLPYVWGGENPKIGFDCSGLIQYAARQAGLSIPRVADAQKNYSKSIDGADAVPADLVFFTHKGEQVAHHVGMYVGNGQMIDAPHTGAQVRVEGIGHGYDKVDYGRLPQLKIPQLASGAKINYDNTLANLHKGEAVLTSPITSKFEALANQLSANGNVIAGEKVEVNFYGPVNSEVDVEAGVTAALRKRDVKLGRERVIK